MVRSIGNKSFCQDLQCASQRGRFHPRRSEIELNSNFGKTFEINIFVRLAGLTIADRLYRFVKKIFSIFVTFSPNVTHSNQLFFSRSIFLSKCYSFQTIVQGVRYTAVEGEVDEARITEILNRWESLSILNFRAELSQNKLSIGGNVFEF